MTERDIFKKWQRDYLNKCSAPDTTYDTDEFHFTIWQSARADPLLQEAITLLERCRDNLLYPAEKRIKDSEIDAFLEKCK